MFLKMNFKEMIKYFIKDKVSLVIFIAIIVESLLFVDILNTPGAASLNIGSNELIILSKIHLYILFTLVLMSFAYLFSYKTRSIILTIINIMYSILIIGDIWYFRGFNDFISLHNLQEMKNIQNPGGTFFAMLRSIDLVFLILNILVIILVIVFTRNNKTKNKRRGMFSLLLFFPILIILILHFILDAPEQKYGDGLFKTQFTPYSTMRNLTPIGYHFYDNLLFVKDNISYTLNEEEKKKIDDWINYKNEDLPQNNYYSKFKGKNIIIIQMESLESFVINQSYNGQEITPNLNKVLKNSYYFPEFYEQVNNGNSSDADLMINTSVLPVRDGSTFFRFPNNKYRDLGYLFKKEGYNTRFLSSSDGEIWNINNAYKSFGYDECIDIEYFAKNKENRIFNMGVSDEDFYKEVVKLSEKEKEPFLYYCVTVSSHVPFNLPEDLRTLNLSKEFNDSSMGDYFQSINYADRQLGIFMNTLDSKGILDDSVVVIVGDHIGVHKYYSDKIDGMKEKESWWQNDLRVPFIIYNKDIKGEEIQTIGAQIDIFPSIAYIMGIEDDKYKNTTMGRNLFNTNRSYAIVNNGNIKGEEDLSNDEIKHINETFNVADLILRYNYFNP